MTKTKGYDLILVGTGFASSFFLHKYLARAEKNSKILILERGKKNPHAWQVQHRKNSPTNPANTYTTNNNHKRWIHTLGFGGGSNCWWACTPRFLPNDFQLQSRYGVSYDWPIRYDRLEPYYSEAESIMNIAGPSDHSPCPRSQAYPLPPHRLSSVDKLLLQHYPDTYFSQPAARASVPTQLRPKCCGNGVCHICPINAKFTIQHDLAHLFNDPRVEIKTETEVTAVKYQNGAAQGIYFKSPNTDQDEYASAEKIAMGANAFFNPFILQKSGIKQNALGAYLNEQEAIYVTVDLQGLDNYDGGTSITGHGYQFYDGDHRRDFAACLLESWNTVDSLRIEENKWRQRVVFKAVFEELPQADNRVTLKSADNELPYVEYKGPTEYVKKSIAHFKEAFPKWISVLPVEKITFSTNPLNTEAHIQGSTRMGANPIDSVVDANLQHHQLNNLWVLGSGAFPSCPPANPSLTISALSLMAADHIFS